MITDQIRQLAGHESSDRAILSLYLDTTRGDETQEDRMRLFLKDELRRLREELSVNGHKRELDKATEQIASYVGDELQPNTRGLAIFSCPGDGFFLPIELPVPLTPQMSIGSRPHLKPLALVRQTYPPTAVVMVDAKYARVFELAYGQILQEIDYEHADTPRMHDQGGWSQANMQRHVRDHIDRHHKDVAETLSKMVDSGRFRCVIISGQERNLSNFQNFLPKRVTDKLIGTLHLDIRTDQQEVAQASMDLISRHQIRTRGERLVTLEEAGRKQERGALGPESVATAANMRRIMHLFIGADATISGWQCTSCRTIGHQVPLSCPACNAPVRSVDLVEELIAAAETEGAEIELVPGPSVLDQYEGVGALLRF